MSKEQDIIKWWQSYSEEEAKRRKEEWLNEHNKSSLSNEVLDKLTKKEFNTVLYNTLTDIDFHMTDTFMHITEEERNRWNKVTYESLTKPASTESDGLMTKEDKIKLDRIADGANNYTHPKYRPITTYKFKKVDEYGHIYGSSEPEVLPVTVDSVDTLNGKPIEYFAKNNNQVFNNITVPNIDVATAKDNAAVNYSTMKSYTLDGAIQITSITNNLDTRKLWFNISNRTAYYYNDNTWKPFSLPIKPVPINDDGKIDKSLLPNTGYPIGSIAIFYGNMIPNNYLLLNGQVVKKSDYPKLWDLVALEGGSVLQPESNYNQINNSPWPVYFFSTVSNDDTLFRLPSFNKFCAVTPKGPNAAIGSQSSELANIYGTFPITPFGAYQDRYPEDIELYNASDYFKNKRINTNISYRTHWTNDWGYMGFEYKNKDRESTDLYYKPLDIVSRIRDARYVATRRNYDSRWQPRSIGMLYCIKAK